jgi:hypothetical protein
MNLSLPTHEIDISLIINIFVVMFLILNLKRFPLLALFPLGKKICHPVDHPLPLAGHMNTVTLSKSALAKQAERRRRTERIKPEPQELIYVDVWRGFTPLLLTFYGL